MKRFISLLLVCLMVLPFGMLSSVSVTADTPDPGTKTVYLSDTGADTNDGLTPEAPKKTITQCYAALGTEGGNIIIVDKFTHTANFIAPKHTGTVTIKGADSSAQYVMGSGYRYFLGGPTVLDGFKLVAKAGTLMIVCLYNDFTATETLTTDRTKDVILVAGGQSDTDYKKARDFGTAKDVTITLNGGSWQEVIGSMRQGWRCPTASAYVTKTADDFANHHVTFNIGGSAVIAKMFAFSRSAGGKDVIAPDSACTINLNGGKITHFLTHMDQKAYATGFENGVTINVSKNFDLSASFNGDTGANATTRLNSTGVYCGITALYAYGESYITTASTVAKGTLVIDDEIYDSFVTNNKVRLADFSTVKKASGGAGGEIVPPPDPDVPDTTPDTVYLSDSGSESNDGLTPATAVNKITRAYQLLGKKGGTIIITDTFTQAGNFYPPSAHTGKITIKGADENAKLAVASNSRFYLGGETEFTDLHIAATGNATWYLVCNFNNCKISDTVKVTRKGQFLIALGAQGGSTAGERDYTPKDSTLVIEGGDWDEVIGVVRQWLTTPNGTKTADDFAGVDAVITIAKNASVNKLFAWTRGLAGNFLAPNATVRLNLLGGKVNNFICQTNNKSAVQGAANGMTVYIGKDYDISKSFTKGTQDAQHYVVDGANGSVFYGISPECAYHDDDITASLVNNSGVIICAELYDELKDNTRIRKSAFSYVIKEGDTVPEPTPPDIPQPPVTPDQPQDKVIYVSTQYGDDAYNGKTSATPFKTITKAYRTLGAEGGTIVLVGEFVQTGSFTEPAHKGKITIKGYDKNAYFHVTKGVRYILSGETEFTDLRIEADEKATWYVICRFNNFTVSDTVTVKRTKDFLVNLGVNHDTPATPKSATLTLNGGNWAEVLLTFRNGYATGTQDPAAWDGVNLTLNVGGNVTIAKVFAFSRSMDKESVFKDFLAKNSSVRINLLGGKVTHFICQTDNKNIVQGHANGMTVYIGKDFDLDASFNAGKQNGNHWVQDGKTHIFYGISAESAFARGDKGATSKLIKKSQVIIASEQFEALRLHKAIRGNSFLYLYEEGQPPAPAPNTGDSTWVVAVVAIIAVMGCAVTVVCKKKASR